MRGIIRNLFLVLATLSSVVYATIDLGDCTTDSDCAWNCGGDSHCRNPFELAGFMGYLVQYLECASLFGSVPLKI
ncbi:hypothetical protein HYALB_00009259 [Hymenoscyphus albidus]|uniref:Uncharacterized protein n=1 Tax=Hymenoscyphus albidus TaxID=595503 RepID=A0A9N9LVU9_9HELO|nr:hypothetical protein HYALB_00009259 [Hymenoscyphus albidus]